LTHSPDKKIIDSWKKNTAPWISAISNHEIESRTLITNHAIVKAILEKRPQSVLDIGCGEGWLVRELVQSGIDTLGVDIIPDFINYAQQQKKGRFKCVSYEDFSYKLLQEKFEVLVCNFSLLGKESVENIFHQSVKLLNHGGSFIIQTIHPQMASEKDNYIDGWRQSSWTGFNSQFCDPPPWYFRTIESWKKLFSNNNFKLTEVREPINPLTQSPASILFIGEM